jgi:hypothetical protein
MKFDRNSIQRVEVILLGVVAVVVLVGYVLARLLG